MSVLIRRIYGSSGPWQKLLQGPSIDTLRANPPLWVVKDFIPTERDQGRLSVFEVENEDDVIIIAAAFGFKDPKLEAQQIYLSVKATDLSAASIKVESSLGNLDHDFADTRHREIEIVDIMSAARVAGLFVGGAMISIEGKTVLSAIKKSARKNEFHFGRICARRPINTNHGANNTARFIGEADITAKGAEA